MAHDAATGEIVRERDGPVVAYVITQNGTIPRQLDCGVRSLDYRPYLDSNGDLIASHGDFKVHKKMADTITDITTWLASHPTELVLLYVSHCGGASGCGDAAANLLSSRKISSIHDCGILNTLTVMNATKLGALPSGGSLLAVFDCMDEQYDPSIECYGKNFTCYNPDSEDFPMMRFKRYMNTSTTAVPSSGQLWMTQAHWQNSAETVELGILHGSTILLDEQRAGINAWLLRAIQTHLFSHLSIVEVDNACDLGPQLYTALANWRE
jgi:hypothetical protein